MPKPRRTVLIVDETDEGGDDYGQQLQQNSTCLYQVFREGYTPQTLTILGSQQIDNVLLIFEPPDAAHLNFLKQLREQRGESCPPIVVIGTDNAEIAVQALKNGATDYLVKAHITPDDLCLAMSSAGKKLNLTASEPAKEELLQETRAALKASEAFNQGILDSSNDCIKVLALEGQILYINQGGLSTIEAESPQAILKRNWISLWQGVDQEQAKAAITTAKGGKSGHFQGYCPTLQGKPKWWDVVVSPLRDELGQVTKLIVVSRDMTAQKQAEMTLRQSEQRYRSLIEATAQIIWDSPGDQGEFSTEQPGWSAFTGQTFDELKGWGWLNAVHLEERAMTAQAWLTAVTNQTLYEVEHRLRRHDGVYRYMSVRAVPVFTEEGRIREWIGVHTDITARKQAEAALRESEERFRTLADNISQFAWMADATGWIFWYNHRWLEYTGATLAAMEGWGWQQVHHPDHVERVVRKFRRCIEAGELWEDTFPLRGHDGKYRWFLSRALPIRDAAGKILRWFGTNTDITKLKRIETALRQSEDRLRMAIESARLGTWDWDLTTNQLTWDTGCKAMFGLPPQAEVTIETFFAGLHPEERDRLEQVIQTALDAEGNGSYDTEYRTLGIQDGIERWIAAKGQVYFDSNRTPLRFVGTVLDITGQKQTQALQAQLLQREQAAREEAERANRVKDEFLAILSHELRSPLNPILGWARLLQTREFSETKTAQALATIERNAKLQTQLIDDLLDVAKILRGKLNLKLASVNLAAVIKAAMETVEAAATAKSISLQAVLPNVGEVRGDTVRLQQIIWNLLSNAIKFTSGGGQVNIRLERIDHQAQVTVKDTGKGISPDFLPHIFESFRQQDASITRQFGGLGLGLAIVRYLVEAHGGTITAVSPGEGQGAMFTVSFPLLMAEPQSPKTEELPDSEFDLTGISILTVDDHADSQELLTVLLTQHGAQVQTATSAAEALATLDSFQPHVLVSDIGMPEVNGYTLIQQIRALPPEKGGQMGAIALTAYAREEDQQRALENGYQVHLAKPLEPNELVRAIQKLARVSS